MVTQKEIQKPVCWELTQYIAKETRQTIMTQTSIQDIKIFKLYQANISLVL